MSHTDQIYFEGYDAFEKGDYEKAFKLSETCLATSPPDSYWYAGALGLECWIANFTHNMEKVERSAEKLLSLETGDDKSWFDGLAWFNLGLARAQVGRMNDAKTYFLSVAESYRSQELQARQPAEWQMVLEYFATLARWSASGENAEWVEFMSRIDKDEVGRGELAQQLLAAARIILRCSKGEEVKKDAIEMVKTGVSRTFLSPVLLDCTLED